MKPELQEALFNDFPLLYRRRTRDGESLMYCGFQCGDGWEPLVRALSARLEREIVRLNRSTQDAGWEAPYAVQAKQKFGELRVYMNWQTPEMRRLINEATALSRKICETCGKPGKIGTNKAGWVRCACDEHGVDT